MYSYNKDLFFVSLIVFATKLVSATEFTFELADNDEECFHETIREKTPCVLEYQVVSGGSLDVDVIVESPTKQILYQELRKDSDTLRFNSTDPGDYAICFSNQFSSFTHKTVFMSFVAGDDNPLLKSVTEHATVMTFMEATSDELHENLNDIVSAQTHYRLQESQGRRFAEELRERVLWWSLMETFVVIAIGVVQVLILRNFFSGPTPVKSDYTAVRTPRYGYM